MKRRKFLNLWALCTVMIMSACKNAAFLDVVPDKALNTLRSYEDYQALLNNTMVMNVSPSIGDAASDEYYKISFIGTTDGIASRQKLYTWRDEDYPLEWSLPYQVVFYANTVLEGLDGDDHPKARIVRGQALFHRAYMFFQLAQVFAPPYEPESAPDLSGLPLRLTADVNEPISRSSLADTYNRILRDAKEAAKLLGPSAAGQSQPSRQAAYGLLARTYLVTGDFVQALFYADSCLALQPNLMDYNRLDPTANYPFTRLNEEVIFQTTRIAQGTLQLFANPICRISEEVVAMYHPDDLRKDLFFIDYGDGVGFKGSYDGSSAAFHGIGTDEIYLIAAEASTRLNSLKNAHSRLNTLLSSRWRFGAYEDVEGLTKEALLARILQERRKSLIFRGLRWMDLRRLNVLGAALTLTRQLEGQIYTLPPGDPRWTFLIPQEVTSFHPLMQQNHR